MGLIELVPQENVANNHAYMKAYDVMHVYLSRSFYINSVYFGSVDIYVPKQLKVIEALNITAEIAYITDLRLSYPLEPHVNISNSSVNDLQYSTTHDCMEQIAKQKAMKKEKESSEEEMTPGPAVTRQISVTLSIL